MRRDLGYLLGARCAFTARIGRFGLRPAAEGGTLPTVLIEEVRLAGSRRIVADHLWMPADEAWRARTVTPGLRVGFTATVVEYDKGHGAEGVASDFTLARPTRPKPL